MTVRRFLRDIRAGATALTAGAVIVMTVGGVAVVSDHAWLVDKRDGFKTAANGAATASMLEMNRLLIRDPEMSDEDLDAALEVVARRWILLNLGHLSPDRYARAKGTLVVEVVPDRNAGAVGVSASADLGGTLFASRLPLFAGFRDPDSFHTDAGAEAPPHPVELVLAIDVSGSMLRCLDGSHPCPGPDQRISIVKRASAKLVEVLDPREENRIAIGIVPWFSQVRLDSRARDAWAMNGWAEYPRSRRYAVPYRCSGSEESCRPPPEEQDLPLYAPENWRGCLDQQRLRAGDVAALPERRDFLAPPWRSAFAQGFFPASYGTAYRCLADPLPEDMLHQFCFDQVRTSAQNQQFVREPQFPCRSGTPPILPLSTDRVEIERSLSNLRPVGLLTHSSLGVLWGQRLLAHSWKGVWGGDVHPVDPAADNETRKAIVLLTDGEDTQCGRTNPSCAGSPAGVSRTEACTAAKATGTEIYVIAAMYPDRISGELAGSLRACSSQADDPDGTYVFLNNASPETLDAAFADIVNQLRSVRRVY